MRFPNGTLGRPFSTAEGELSSPSDEAAAEWARRGVPLVGSAGADAAAAALAAELAVADAAAAPASTSDASASKQPPAPRPRARARRQPPSARGIPNVSPHAYVWARRRQVQVRAIELRAALAAVAELAGAAAEMAPAAMTPAGGADLEAAGESYSLGESRLRAGAVSRGGKAGSSVSGVAGSGGGRLRAGPQDAGGALRAIALLSGRLDPASVCAAGHSMGGATVLSALLWPSSQNFPGGAGAAGGVSTAPVSAVVLLDPVLNWVVHKSARAAWAGEEGEDRTCAPPEPGHCVPLLPTAAPSRLPHLARPPAAAHARAGSAAAPAPSLREVPVLALYSAEWRVKYYSPLPADDAQPPVRTKCDGSVGGREGRTEAPGHAGGGDGDGERVSTKDSGGRAYPSSIQYIRMHMAGGGTGPGSEFGFIRGSTHVEMSDVPAMLPAWLCRATMLTTADASAEQVVLRTRAAVSRFCERHALCAPAAGTTSCTTTSVAKAQAQEASLANLQDHFVTSTKKAPAGSGISSSRRYC